MILTPKDQVRQLSPRSGTSCAENGRSAPNANRRFQDLADFEIGITHLIFFDLRVRRPYKVRSAVFDLSIELFRGAMSGWHLSAVREC